MKNHKQERIALDQWEWDGQPLEVVIASVLAKTKHLIDPKVEYVWGDPSIIGWVPMTELEMAQAKKRREASRAANAAKAAKKEAEERALLEKLKEKYD